MIFNRTLQHLVMTYNCHNGHHNRYKALGGVTHLSRMGGEVKNMIMLIRTTSWMTYDASAI